MEGPILPEPLSGPARWGGTWFGRVTGAPTRPDGPSLGCGPPVVLFGGSVVRAVEEYGGAPPGPGAGVGPVEGARGGALDQAPGSVRSPVGVVAEYSDAVERGVGAGAGTPDGPGPAGVGEGALGLVGKTAWEAGLAVGAEGVCAATGSRPGLEAAGGRVAAGAAEGDAGFPSVDPLEAPGARAAAGSPDRFGDVAGGFAILGARLGIFGTGGRGAQPGIFGAGGRGDVPGARGACGGTFPGCGRAAEGTGPVLEEGVGRG